MPSPMFDGVDFWLEIFPRNAEKEAVDECVSSRFIFFFFEDRK